jgi:hypothetical protein
MCPIDDVKPVKNAVNPAALTPGMAAKMLGLEVEIVQKDIFQGAQFMVASLSSYGTWYSLEPTQWNYRDGWETGSSWYGDNDMGLGVDLNQKPIVVQDLEIIPQSFM